MRFPMKFNYFFVDINNGHETIYYPFSSNTVISQDYVTNHLSKIPGAGRMGTKIGHLLDILEKNNIEFEQVKCPCCDKFVQPMAQPPFDLWKKYFGIEWIILNGISGNY
jgi:hypothetical protein